MEVIPLNLIPTLDPPLLLRPVYSGTVSAGQSRFPSPAQDYETKDLDLNQKFIIHRTSSFFFGVKGDSMVDEGILPGSLLVVDRDITPKNGQIVLALLEGEWMIKTLVKRGGHVQLLSKNKEKAYSPIQPKDGEELIIWGVVTSVHTSTL